MASQPMSKDSMRSTWYFGDRKQWSFPQRLIAALGVYPDNRENPPPVYSKTAKIPYMPQWTQQAWILPHAFAPILLHQAWIWLTSSLPFYHHGLGKLATFMLYFTFFNISVIQEVKMLHKMGQKYGYLDGDVHERDGVPDAGVAKVAAALYKTTGSRILLSVFLTYDPNHSPAESLGNWKWWLWLGLEAGLYGIVLDFFFYWYHRAMHDVDGLWKFHRTHHLTKHPNALLSAYSDHEQEFFDMVVIPLVTLLTLRAMGLPMGFYDLWICHQYVTFAEVAGHSGLRIHASAPSTLYWLLRLCGADLVIEDHDMHHRNGYRKTHNYGKQTRLWDLLFGTCSERIESIAENVDYANPAYFPIKWSYT